jgi:hypothetical protein
MNDNAFAMTNIWELQRPKSQGEKVNVHVLESSKVPQPNYEQLRIVVESGRLPDSEGPADGKPTPAQPTTGKPATR